MDLTDEQLERYARHIILKEVGGAGQARLLAARVLVVGAGGLGSPLILYLAAAGVGTIGVVDFDDVSLSNLQRQVLHTTTRLGTPKTESAAAAVRALNPDVTVVSHTERLGARNARDLIGWYDIVADGCDTFATRFLVNDTCHVLRKTLVSGRCRSSTAKSRRSSRIWGTGTRATAASIPRCRPGSHRAAPRPASWGRWRESLARSRPSRC